MLVSKILILPASGQQGHLHQSFETHTQRERLTEMALLDLGDTKHVFLMKTRIRIFEVILISESKKYTIQYILLLLTDRQVDCKVR